MEVLSAMWDTKTEEEKIEMKFTKTPPTEPGMFRRRDEEGYETLAEVNRTDQGCLACKMDGKLGYVVKTMGGEWCRLVPVDEVRKAWGEGFVTEQSYDPQHDRIRWESSRAWRVTKGLE